MYFLLLVYVSSYSQFPETTWEISPTNATTIDSIANISLSLIVGVTVGATLVSVTLFFLIVFVVCLIKRYRKAVSENQASIYTLQQLEHQGTAEIEETPELPDNDDVLDVLETKSNVAYISAALHVPTEKNVAYISAENTVDHTVADYDYD